MADVRAAARSLRRSPGFVAVATLTLALAVAGNTTVFSAVDAVLLKQLPFPDAGRLVAIWETVPARGETEAFVAFPNYRDYRALSPGVEDLAAFYAAPNSDVNLTGGARPVRANVARVTSNYFDILGVQPALGRAFTPEEDQVGNHRVTILSHDLWREQFGADPELVGGSVQVNGFAYAVVGIMPADFRAVGSLALGEAVDMWRPLAPSAEQQEARWWRNLRLVGRLTPDARPSDVERELSVTAERIAQEDPENQRGRGVRLVTLRDQTVGPVRARLYLLWGAVALVLLVACANLANLLLVRFVQRGREISIRAGLGATRGRIVRLLLLESLLIAALSSVVSVLLSSMGITALRALAGDQAPLLDRVSLDLRALGFTAALAAATGLAFGILPALHAGRAELGRSMRGDRGAGPGVSRWATRSFVAIQLALALTLLAGSGLLIRSFMAVTTVDPGFRTPGLLTLQVELPMVTAYPTQEERSRFFRELRAELAGLPAVTSVATGSTIPLDADGRSSTFWIDGRPEPDVENRPSANVLFVSPEYLETLDIPLLQGRPLLASDDAESPMAVVINRSLARRFWPDESPLGARLQVDAVRDATVVGVVGDVHFDGPTEVPLPTIYYAADQVTYNFMTVAIRTAGRARPVLPLVEEAMRARDPDLPLHNVTTMDELHGRSVRVETFLSRLLATLAVLGLVIAAVGTWGVMAASLARQRRELAVRSALGAAPGRVFWTVVRDGGGVVLAGLGLGLVVALGLARPFQPLLFETAYYDPMSYGVAAAVLAGVAMLTIVVNAQRAAGTDPAATLRSD